MRLQKYFENGLNMLGGSGILSLFLLHCIYMSETIGFKFCFKVQCQL